jgi:hypothetical protein
MNALDVHVFVVSWFGEGNAVIGDTFVFNAVAHA